MLLGLLSYIFGALLGAYYIAFGGEFSFFWFMTGYVYMTIFFDISNKKYKYSIWVPLILSFAGATFVSFYILDVSIGLLYSNLVMLVIIAFSYLFKIRKEKLKNNGDIINVVIIQFLMPLVFNLGFLFIIWIVSNDENFMKASFAAVFLLSTWFFIVRLSNEKSVVLNLLLQTLAVSIVVAFIAKVSAFEVMFFVMVIAFCILYVGVTRKIKKLENEVFNNGYDFRESH